MMAEGEAWLALDVGGANVKAAHSRGDVCSVPFELWRQPERLPDVLRSVAAAFPGFEDVALTMTAELCDCYPTKSHGVRAVLDAATSALPETRVHVWGLDGRFHPVAEAAEWPSLAAASNWLALATVAARLAGGRSGLLIDVGSTTTDLIPLSAGSVAARGRTDTERLRSGELVYAGVRRTPLCALADRLPFRGRATALAAELFATTLDAFLTLGEIPEDPESRQTADGRPATTDAALDRLARMVGADREGFTPEDALRFSEAVREALLMRLTEAATLTRGEFGRPEVIVVGGSGEFLARRLARRLLAPRGAVVSLSETWGPSASAGGCAWALIEIVRGSAKKSHT